MPRRTWSDGQEIVFQDLSKGSVNLERELYDRVLLYMLQGVEDAFFGDSFGVTFVGSTLVNVNSGVGFQTDSSQVKPEPEKRLLYLSADVQKTLVTPDATFDRIDILAVKWARQVITQESRKYKPPIGAISTVLFDVETDWTDDIQVVTGTPGGVPVAPPVPAGYIKLSQCLVHAVTGLGGPSDITDFRTKLPVAGDGLINSTGYNRLTAGVTTPISQLLQETDALLEKGYQEYTDFDVLSGNPTDGNPTAGKVRFFHDSGVFYFLGSGGIKTPVGSGAGGAGSANWYPAPGNAPVEDEENGEKVWKYSAGAGQALNLYLKVPQSYIAGRPISLYVAQYSPSAANTQLLSGSTSLFRKNLDPVDTPAAAHASTNSAITNTVANQYREVLLDLTDGSGLVGGFGVTPGDLLKVALTRGSDTDTDDIRFLPNATEPTFT